MAIGRTQINMLREKNDNLVSQIPNLDDCLNTFNYVITNLSEWADETVVGNDLKSQLTSLTNCVNTTIECTKKLCTYLNNYIDQQEQTNQGIGI